MRKEVRDINRSYHIHDAYKLLKKLSPTYTKEVIETNRSKLGNYIYILVFLFVCISCTNKGPKSYRQFLTYKSDSIAYLISEYDETHHRNDVRIAILRKYTKNRQKIQNICRLLTSNKNVYRDGLENHEVFVVDNVSEMVDTFYLGKQYDYLYHYAPIITEFDYDLVISKEEILVSDITYGHRKIFDIDGIEVRIVEYNNGGCRAVTNKKLNLFQLYEVARLVPKRYLGFYYQSKYDARYSGELYAQTLFRGKYGPFPSTRPYHRVKDNSLLRPYAYDIFAIIKMEDGQEYTDVEIEKMKEYQKYRPRLE